MTSKLPVLFKYLIPSIFTNVCVFLFGIVDGIFVGNGVGTDALGAVNIVWPFVMVAYGLNVLTTIGGATITAIAIGKKDFSEANTAFNSSLILTIIVATVLCLLGTILTGPISILLGATPQYYGYVKDYLFWYSVFLIPSQIGICFENFCRNDGDPNLVLITTVISTIVNIVLDYVLIFPIPMGIKGAAIATGIANLVRALTVSIHFIRKKGILRIKLITLKRDESLEILRRGVPEMIAQFASPVTIVCMNFVLGRNLGSIGINAYAIICYVASFALAIMYGCSEGIQPLFGQSYGAKNYKELKFYFYAGIIVALIGSSLCVLITLFYMRIICEIYGTDLTTTNYVIEVTPKFAWGFILAGVNALISTYLYSTKRTKASVYLNVARSLVFNSLCILLLPYLFGIQIVWYCYGISEVLVLIYGNYLIRKTERKGLQFV